MFDGCPVPLELLFWCCLVYLSEGTALGCGGSLFSSLGAQPGCLLAGKRGVGLG